MIWVVWVCRKQQGPVAGTGRRLGRDVDSTSRLGSLDTSERNYWVAHRSRSEPRRPDWPVYSRSGHWRTAHVRVADLGTPRECNLLTLSTASVQRKGNLVFAVIQKQGVTCFHATMLYWKLLDIKATRHMGPKVLFIRTLIYLEGRVDRLCRHRYIGK